jgi:hypothetical protein
MATPNSPQFDRYLMGRHDEVDHMPTYTSDSDVHGNPTVERIDGPSLYQRTGTVAPRSEKGYYYRSSPNAVTALVEVRQRGRRSTNIMPKTPKGYTTKWADMHSEQDGQIPLFTHREDPGESVLSYMNSVDDPQSRAAAMRLMGVAAVDAQQSHGHELIPDSSLSKHSRRIVDHLADVGATEVPRSTYSNTVTFLDGPTDAYRRLLAEYTPIPKETLGAGKGVLRSVLRGQRKPKPEPEYEQLQLDLD